MIFCFEPLVQHLTKGFSNQFLDLYSFEETAVHKADLDFIVELIACFVNNLASEQIIYLTLGQRKDVITDRFHLLSYDV